MNNSNAIRNCLIFMSIILALFVLKATQSVALPVVIAVFLFCFANPIMDRLKRLKVPNILSIVIVMAIFIVIVLVLVYVIFNMVNMILGKLDYYALRLRVMDQTLSAFLNRHLEDIPPDFSVLAALNFDWLGIAKNWLSSIANRIMSLASDFMVVLVTFLFLLLERTTFAPKMAAAFPKDRFAKISIVGGRIVKQITKYLFLKTILSAVTGFSFYVVARIVNLDFALLWGALAFILNYIPTIGSIIVTVLTILMAIIQFFPEPGPIFFVAISTVLIEIIIGNIIDPRVQGDRLDISPFVILVFLSLWGYIWGILGMFLAVPILSILKIICSNVPSLRPVAIVLSSGRGYAKEYEIARRRSKRRMGAKEEEDDGIILPETSKDEKE